MFIKSAINYICYFVSHNLVASAEIKDQYWYLYLYLYAKYWYFYWYLNHWYWYWYLLVEYLIEEFSRC